MICNFLFVCIAFFYSNQTFSSEIPEAFELYQQGPDIPKVGSSLFDKIYSHTDPNGKSVYNLGTDVKSLITKNNMKDEFVYTFFPFSRSLQRPQDLSYDPLLNPRFVFSPREDENALVRGKLFFGFVEAKDQVEVISYNDEAGRFEFQLITNVSSNPEVFYVNRGKCLTCHQGHSPIFSTPAWADSSFGVMSKLVDAQLLKVGSNIETLVDENLGLAPFQEQVALFDSLVREANTIYRNELSWISACNEDRKCRLGQLLNTLARKSPLSKEYIRHAKKIVTQSPLHKAPYSSSFISSFDIGATEAIESYGSLDNVVNSDLALMQIISNLSILTKKNNPASVRTKYFSEVNLMSQLASFTIQDIETLNQEVPNTVTLSQLLIDLFNEGSPIFNKDTINKLEIMSIILKRARSNEHKNYSYWLNKPTPDKRLFGGHLQPIFRKKELNIFSHYCHSCHAIGLSFPPQFLLGSEEDVISQIRQLKPRILQKLTNRLMPPKKENRDLLKDSGDYDRLVSYLQSIE